MRMSRAQRICDRLPRFYKHWDRQSLVYGVVSAVAQQLDQVEEEVISMMKAHWVDTAQGDELDRLGLLVRASRILGEDDARLRARLKRAVGEYEGGGTVPAILEAVRALIGARDEADVRIVENPPAPGSAEFRVIAGDTWAFGSNSILDATPSMILTVEEGGEVSDPQVTNLDTGESVGFKGKLSGGEQLVIGEGKAINDGRDATARLTADKPPRILRRGSSWRYRESLRMLVGVFDEATFDEHTFAVGVPYVRIRFDWTRLQPATFEVQVRSEALRRSGLTESHIGRFVDSMKAAGVNAVVTVTEK